MPNEYVRVKDKSTGHHYSVLAAEAENNPEAYQVLKQDAVDANGDPLPGEIPAETAPKPAAKKAASKRAAAKRTAAQTPAADASETNGQQATTTKES